MPTRLEQPPYLHAEQFRDTGVARATPVGATDVAAAAAAVSDECAKRASELGGLTGEPEEIVAAVGKFIEDHAASA